MIKGREIPTKPARAMGIFSSSDNLSVLLCMEEKATNQLAYTRAYNPPRVESTLCVLTFESSPLAPNPESELVVPFHQRYSDELKLVEWSGPLLEVEEQMLGL